MTSQPDYLRYLASARQALLADQLRDEGYTVQTNYPAGELSFDLVARKGTRAIAYEFKSGPSPRTTRQGLRSLQEAANREGLELRIVVVNPPPKVRVEFEYLSDHLLHHMFDHFPQALDSLSSHTEIDGVCDLDISEVAVRDGSLHVSGSGIVDVTLGYGSDSDEGPSSGNAFPFVFKVKLATDGSLESVDTLDFDTSTFYE